MQQQPNAQLLDYIHLRLSAAVPEPTIRQELANAGWAQPSIGEAFEYLKNYQTAAQPPAPMATSPDIHRVRNGVLWIASPAIVLLGSTLIGFLLRLAGIHSPIFNIFLIVVGVAGVLLIFVGPIIGIVRLNRKPK